MLKHGSIQPRLSHVKPCWTRLNDLKLELASKAGSKILSNWCSSSYGGLVIPSRSHHGDHCCTSRCFEAALAMGSEVRTVHRDVSPTKKNQESLFLALPGVSPRAVSHAKTASWKLQVIGAPHADLFGDNILFFSLLLEGVFHDKWRPTIGHHAVNSRCRLTWDS